MPMRAILFSAGTFGDILGHPGGSSAPTCRQLFSWTDKMRHSATHSDVGATSRKPPLPVCVSTHVMSNVGTIVVHFQSIVVLPAARLYSVMQARRRHHDKPGETNQ